MIATAPHPAPEPAAPRAALPQYSRTRILGVWAAAALPMGLLSWVGAPLLADVIGGPDALTKSLLLLLTAGLIWQFALVCILLAPERRSPSWPGVREALWLRPLRPRTAWLLVIPLGILFAAEELIPSVVPHTIHRELGPFFESDAGHAMMSGAWGWYALIAVMVVFNTVLGEELFRGLLLPRMNGAFGRGDWIANGVLFAGYHVHMPWVIPAVLLDTFALAWPAKWFRSSLLPIVIHSMQSVVILVVGLTLVL